MASVPDRRKLQSLYPVPQARTGLDARKPQVFKVPALTLALLLYVPPLLVTALTSLYIMGIGHTLVPRGLYFVLFLAVLVLGILFSLGLLAQAVRIIERNATHFRLLEWVYICLLIAACWSLLTFLHQWSSGMNPFHVLAAEAIVLFVPVLAIVLWAKQLSR